jgi:FMN phosphatase YigB (HAD superfamily)
MTFTLLLDLDDTLLDTNLESFVPAYVRAITQHLQPDVDGERVVQALIAGMSAMNASEDPRSLLSDVFETEFYLKMGMQRGALSEPLSDFFLQVFPTLAGLTKRKPDANQFIDWALSSGYRLAIATDPLFYYTAVEERIRWAGFDPARFALISSADQFHFTKTHPAYYAEMLGRLGWPDGPVLMVGNDVQRDVLPAQRLGLKTFLLETKPASVPAGGAGRGTFDDLRAWIESSDASEFEPSFKSGDGILGIATSTPAVLYGLCLGLREEQWAHEATPEDWAMTEIVCHLRDTDREVYAMQLELMIEKPDAFIPRPDTGVWASERDYLSEDGVMALQGFADARIRLVDRLKALPADIWKRKARHAIFGPTDFLEIMGFVSDHDRMHVQQAWRTLQGLQVSASI